MFSIFLEQAFVKTYQTANQYQWYHGLALLIIAHQPLKHLHRIGSFFTAGILLFSGSLYLFCLTQKKLFTYLTPLGGLCLILGWIHLLFYKRHPL